MPRKKKEDDNTVEIEAEGGESGVADDVVGEMDVYMSAGDHLEYLNRQEKPIEDGTAFSEAAKDNKIESGVPSSELDEAAAAPIGWPDMESASVFDTGFPVMPEDVSVEPAPKTPEEAGGVTTVIDSAEIEAGESITTELSVTPLSAAVRRRNSFYDLNLNRLDRDLTPAQAQEWNSIYASYRSRSILSGMAIGVDQNTFEISGEDGQSKVTTIRSLIIIDYRVKILIPETELWVPGDERPQYVLPNVVGSFIDYIILEVDRVGECAVASRRMALTSKRFLFSRNDHHEGERLTCKLVAVGPKVCTVECNGFDIQLTQRDLTYSAVPDLREKYRPGMELDCILKEYDKAGKLEISVKEAQVNPFDGADKRHPVGSRRHAVISGKYRGGVFCTLPDGTVCHCLYSSRHSDADFRDGDSVIITIREYNYGKQQIFGRILTKW